MMYKNKVYLGVLLSILFLANMIFQYPGIYIFDSLDQLRQAQYLEFNDWHPPIMAWMWSKFILFFQTKYSFFIAQITIYWASIGLIAYAVLFQGKLRALPFILILIGAFPLFLYFNSIVSKDSQMAAMFLFAFSLAFYFRLQIKKVPFLVKIIIAAILTYGVLLRTNSIFAVGPLILYCFFNASDRLGVYKKVFLSGLIGIVLLLVSPYVNHKIFTSHETSPIRSLQLFDLFGIASNSQDSKVLQPLFNLSLEQVEACYTPYWWDSLGPVGVCSFVSGRVMSSGDKVSAFNRSLSADDKTLRDMWINAIMGHPASYFLHRIKHFNIELNYLVPSLVCRFAKDNFSRCSIHGSSAQDIGNLVSREINKDYLKKSFLFWPIVWLVLGFLVSIFALKNKLNSPVLSDSILTLSLSGVLYISAYLIIGVASDSRYMYWPILAIFYATGLSYEFISEHIKIKSTKLYYPLFVLIFIISSGYISRVCGFDAFMY